MFYKIVTVVLISLLLHNTLVAQTQPQSPKQTPAQMQQVLRKAQENDKAVNVSLSKKINDKKKLAGKVIEVSDADFTLIDSKTGAATKLEYESIRKVNQKGMSTGWKIALVAIAGFVVVVVVATKPWRSE